MRKLTEFVGKACIVIGVGILATVWLYKPEWRDWE